ncbi:MAG: PorV/PorQ family protein [bacterium]|nr:PorV/PorQ family protein [bacterium]
MKNLIISMILFLLLTNTSFAKSVGTTGATLFKIGPGARSVGMGEAFVAISDDANALYFNPSGIGFLKRSELSFMHINWFADTRYEFLAHILSPKYHKGNFGVGLIYLHNSEIKHTTGDTNGPYWSGEYFKFYDYGLILSYGRMIGKRFSLGSNIKLFKEGINLKGDLEYDSSVNTMLDIGMLFKFRRKPINIGFCVQNIGPKAKYKDDKVPLPLNIKLGILYKMFNNNLKVAFDLSKPNDNDVCFNLGLEYILFKIISFRGGYVKGISKANQNFSLGTGFRFKNLYLDYAYTPYGDLGDAHRMSFVIKGSFMEPWERWRNKKKIREREKARKLLKEDEKKYLLKESKTEKKEDMEHEEDIDRWEKLEKEFLKKYE